MPRFNERWMFDAFRSDESPPELVVVQQLPGRGLNVATRLQESADGELVEPEATITVRIRWRPDLSALARFVDTQGRLWLVNGFEQVGRRRYLDVSLSTYGLLLAGGADEFVPAAAPPPGWVLQRAVDDSWVSTLVVNRFVSVVPGPFNTTVVGYEQPGNTLDSRFGFVARVPEGGFKLGSPFTVGGLRGGWPCRINNRGRPLFMTFAQGGTSFNGTYALAAAANVNVAPGGSWPDLDTPQPGRPSRGTSTYLSLVEDRLAPDDVSFAVEILSAGDRITIIGEVS